MPGAPGEALAGGRVGVAGCRPRIPWGTLPRGGGGHGQCPDLLAIPRGCLEAGLESLLKAAGGNLLILRISHCPNILTDRSLWLASCYCRALQAVTYRWVHTTRLKGCTLLALSQRGPWGLHTLPPGVSGKGTQEFCGPWEGSKGLHQGGWCQLCLFNRSATDPVGHEVIWALGAGCREIVSLQVAPLHPW